MLHFHLPSHHLQGTRSSSCCRRRWQHTTIITVQAHVHSIPHRADQLPNLNPSPDTSRDLIKSYSPRSKQSTFNFVHFLASTYVEGTKKKNTSYLLKA
jgi:hypothetical protein